MRRPVPEAAHLRVGLLSVMARHVALLRGINVGGRNKVPMAQLRDLFDSLGYAEVQTLIQSGNVVFDSPTVPKPASLEAAIEKEFGFAVGVMVRSGRELQATMRNNPFPKAPTNSLHVGFLAKKPAAAQVKQLDATRYAPDGFVIRATEIYYSLPNGMGRSKLPGYLDRQLKTPITVRNWNTVSKLVELTS
ncbi:MAG TPA: DUF1697 domain-containing protein [Acidimicrobiia bacterium]|nr:DUF1697 domain-containing protein [Acidimicrobiia bacterium]